MKKVFFICISFAMLVFSCSSTENELITKPTSKPLKVQSSIGTIYYIAQGGISDHSLHQLFGRSIPPDFISIWNKKQP
jgi:hypothetical protein